MALRNGHRGSAHVDAALRKSRANPDNATGARQSIPSFVPRGDDPDGALHPLGCDLLSFTYPIAVTCEQPDIEKITFEGLRMIINFKDGKKAEFSYQFLGGSL